MEDLSSFLIININGYWIKFTDTFNIIIDSEPQIFIFSQPIIPMWENNFYEKLVKYEEFFALSQVN